MVKTTIFLKDMDDFGAVNEVYAEFFSEPYPARSTVEVARLPKDLRVEIEAIACAEARCRPAHAPRRAPTQTQEPPLCRSISRWISASLMARLPRP